MTQAEALEVCAGDVVLTAGGGLSIGWDERPQPAAAHGLQEDSSTFHVLQYKNTSFRIPATFEACFDTVRSLHTLFGAQAVQDFLYQNELFDPRKAHGFVGEIETAEEALGERYVLYRLMTAAQHEVQRFADEAQPKIEQVARSAALQRLEEARQQIRDETRRYFAIRALDVHKALENENDYPAVTASRDWERLLNALAVCQGRLQLARKANKAAADAFARKNTELAMRGIGGGSGREEAPVGLPPGLIMEIIESDPEVARLTGEADAARASVLEYLAGAALEFPILWRIYQTENAFDNEPLGREILQQLRDVWEANNTFADNLNEDPSLVWKFPAVVHEALLAHAVPQLSIAWAAAEMRLSSESGMRTASVVSTFTGLSLTGVVGLGILLGTAAVAPPLVVAITAVDIVANVADAIQEYNDYRLRSNAFRASLNPSRSLGAQPNLLMTVIVITTDLISVLPGPGIKPPR